MRIVMRATKDPRARSRVSWAEKKVERRRGGGDRWTAVVLYRAPRELCSIPSPITIKCLFRDIFSRSDDPSFQHASQHAISARYAMVCTRPNTAQGGWIEWKPEASPELVAGFCWCCLALALPPYWPSFVGPIREPRLSQIQCIETRSGYV